MNRSLRIVAAILGIALVLDAIPVIASSTAFTDVGTSGSYSQAIEALKSEGVVSGYADGSFRPGNRINRAEFLKIILEARGKDLASKGDCFSDVQDEWFAKYVCAAKEEGIISGYADGRFRAEQEINFAEASKILSLAYGQEPDSNSNDWFEPYVRALESSRAIAPSIGGFDKPITRGEMAEMMWRLDENVTDKPSKGFLNIKYPEIAVDFSSDEVQTADSCPALGAVIEGSQGSVQSELYRGGVMQDGVGAPTAARLSMESESKATKDDYSQTNVQVEGVDEADTVKTDGTYVYLVRGQQVTIVQAQPGSAMKEISVIDLAAKSVSPTDLFIDGNRLVVMGQSWMNDPMPYWRPSGADSKIGPAFMPRHYSSQKVAVLIFDISDKSHPVLKREVAIDGNSVSTRMIDGKLYLVANQGMHWGEAPMGDAIHKTDETILPRMSDSLHGSGERPVVRCKDVVILPHVPSPDYLVVATIPVRSDTSEVQRQVILGNAQNVYASLNNLYVTAAQWNYSWDGSGDNTTRTNIYRFAFTSNGVELKAKGSVPGTLLNQFSMDEHGDTFRIATTVDEQWDWRVDSSHPIKPSMNNLYVLSMSLDTVGSIQDIAPGERIYSVRFMGKRAYMVTFKTVDPLFVIDTSDPRNPKILGQLKIPGYSNYLHPYDENHVLGFGKEVDESIDKDKVHSDNAVYYTAILGMKVSLFDVTDVEHPKETSKVVIGQRGTESPLLYNHKALLFDKQRGLLAFPVTVYDKPVDEQVPGASSYTQNGPSFQGAYIYNVNLVGGIQYVGRISHYSDDVYAKMGGYWYDQGFDISRILRLKESLVTVSQNRVQSNVLGSLEIEGKVDLAAIKSSGLGAPMPY